MSHHSTTATTPGLDSHRFVLRILTRRVNSLTTEELNHILVESKVYVHPTSVLLVLLFPVAAAMLPSRCCRCSCSLARCCCCCCFCFCCAAAEAAAAAGGGMACPYNPPSRTCSIVQLFPEATPTTLQKIPHDVRNFVADHRGARFLCNDPLPPLSPFPPPCPP